MSDGPLRALERAWLNRDPGSRERLEIYAFRGQIKRGSLFHQTLLGELLGVFLLRAQQWCTWPTLSRAEQFYLNGAHLDDGVHYEVLRGARVVNPGETDLAIAAISEGAWRVRLKLDTAAPQVGDEVLINGVEIEEGRDIPFGFERPWVIRQIYEPGHPAYMGVEEDPEDLDGQWLLSE